MKELSGTHKINPFIGVWRISLFYYAFVLCWGLYVIHPWPYTFRCCFFFLLSNVAIVTSCLDHADFYNSRLLLSASFRIIRALVCESFSILFFKNILLLWDLKNHWLCSHNNWPSVKLLSWGFCGILSIKLIIMAEFVQLLELNVVICDYMCWWIVCIIL